ncbi:FecCD family ABC transporter permease [Amycolatopsis keratiniphila]|uniref:ABC transporter permease n=1 Tax=Amycolatopsis keratiniphila subsp. keratiniphila TaxID=227715 RepID=A0A1W2M3D6_9PSEU|nr:iron ABC transporter permease [Amycolatopsis keratiniphila]OLZ49724.1 ABC transporter permease [Amycolatopsis keratiniphila subsp. nogabecina]ONF74588.1 ABC transporter permease [Amycolatopsis keratiniphila subsp. keratiniphila]SDU23355.1 iron complex transport system permease protein [Amycolatopsis keratiniphila]
MTTTGRSALLGAALLGLVVVAVLSVGVGAHAIAPGEVVRALLGDGNPSDRAVVLDIRMPRAVLAIGVGAALAVGGVLVQALSRNALAEPGVLGVTAGAGFAIAVGSSFGLAASAPAELGLAVLGAVGASALVYAVGSKSPLRLVLAGTALSAVLLGLTLGLRLLFPDTFDVYRFWSVGSLAGREQAPVTVPLIVIGLSLLGAFAVSRQLNAIALGETVAHTLGANVARVRTVTLLLITLMAGAATALAGPILFVGLIVPHLARRVAGASIPWLIAFAALLGPVLMLAADVGSRILLPTGEVPVAIVTAFLGGPVLIWAVRKYGAAPL